MKHYTALLILTVVLAIASACGKSATAEKLDVAALTAGTTTTARLTFALAERGMHGNGLADNLHFDDGGNQRVVLYYEPTLKDTAAKLEKGKTYKVTFVVEKAGKLIEGTLTAIE